MSRQRTISRRRFLSRSISGLVAAGGLCGAGSGGLPASARAHAAPGDAAPHDLIAKIEPEKIFSGSGDGTTWFSTRACMVPSDAGPIGLMMLAEINGSDYFGPVHVTETRDLGRTWSVPTPVPGLGRKKLDDGTELGSCDYVPEYHAASQQVLAMGHSVYYKGGRFYRDQPPRTPTYLVRDPRGQWSTPRVLEWDDPRGALIYTPNCAQRATLDDGEILMPCSFGADRNGRSVAVFRLRLEGDVLSIRAIGNELKSKTGRGFLEPSIAKHGGTYFLTLRAEDGHGHVTTSRDGLEFAPPKAWAWDNGDPIAMSTTQQRWLPHARGLFLVYTRKDASNERVFRWRSPLYLAQVDLDKLCLIRSTERIAIPMSASGETPDAVEQLGNFHTTAASASESWITVGAFLPKTFRGDTWLARVTWK